MILAIRKRRLHSRSASDPNPPGCIFSKETPKRGCPTSAPTKMNKYFSQERGDGVSATGLVATTWQEARRRPGTLILAFWYLFIVVLFEYFSLSHLGSGFSAWLVRLTSTGSLPPLPAGLAFKLALVYLTFILIVFPFSLGGLVGGVAAGLSGRSSLTSLFAYFRHAVASFWVSLGLVASALVATAILYLAVVLFLNLGSVDMVLAVVTRLIALAVLIFWLATLFYWAGALFLGGELVLPGFWNALRWVIHRPWFAFRATGLAVGLLIVAAALFTFLSAIPFIGAVISMLASGIILTLITTFALVLYRSQTG